MLTHLVFCQNDNEWVATGCRQSVDNTADSGAYTPEAMKARPTCPTCAKTWDKVQASKLR